MPKDLPPPKAARLHCHGVLPGGRKCTKTFGSLAGLQKHIDRKHPGQ